MGPHSSTPVSPTNRGTFTPVIICSINVPKEPDKISNVNINKYITYAIGKPPHLPAKKKYVSTYSKLSALLNNKNHCKINK